MRVEWKVKLSIGAREIPSCLRAGVGDNRRSCGLHMVVYLGGWLR